jgi:hypothetical protein
MQATRDSALVNRIKVDTPTLLGRERVTAVSDDDWESSDDGREVRFRHGGHLASPCATMPTYVADTERNENTHTTQGCGARDVRKVLDLDTSLSSDEGDMRTRGIGLKGMGALVGGLGRKRIAGSEQSNGDLGGALHLGKDRTHQEVAGITGSESMPRENVTNIVEAANPVKNARSPTSDGRDAWTGATVFLGDGGFEIIEEITVYHVGVRFCTLTFSWKPPVC